MIERLISSGDKLEMKSTVSVVLPDGTEGVKTYKSAVYNIFDDGRIGILLPIEQQKRVLLPVDGEYSVCFFTQNGMYQANVKVVAWQKIDNTYIIAVELLTNLHKLQRREYYRFNCVIDMMVKEMNGMEIDLFKKGFADRVSKDNLVNGVIVDISGGGLRFVSRQQFEKGGLVFMRFKLPLAKEEKRFMLAANVVYSGQIESRESEYENRVKFEFIRNSVREEIIQYIFDAERRNRKYGKG